jgi:hypothetical protein
MERPFVKRLKFIGKAGSLSGFMVKAGDNAGLPQRSIENTFTYVYESIGYCQKFIKKTFDFVAKIHWQGCVTFRSPW